MVIRDSSLGIKEIDLMSVELDGRYEKSGEGYIMPIYGDLPPYGKSELLKFLNSVCLSSASLTSEYPNFFDGEVLAHVSYSQVHVDSSLKEGPFKYREQVKIKWQPKNKEPSGLIKILTERFGFYQEDILPSPEKE